VHQGRKVRNHVPAPTNHCCVCCGGRGEGATRNLAHARPSSLPRRGSSSSGTNVLPARRTLVVASCPRCRLHRRASHRITNLGGGRVEGGQCSIRPHRHPAHLFSARDFAASHGGAAGRQAARSGGRSNHGEVSSLYRPWKQVNSQVQPAPRADGQRCNHHAKCPGWVLNATRVKPIRRFDAYPGRFARIFLDGDVQRSLTIVPQDQFYISSLRHIV